MFNRLIPTTLVGSYPQPGWLVDKDILLGSGPPRVRMREVWRPSEDLLAEAQDDAALVVLHDQDQAGIDIVGDGEVRRESYFNHFANALEGIDIDDPGIVPGSHGQANHGAARCRPDPPHCAGSGAGGRISTRANR